MVGLVGDVILESATAALVSSLLADESSPPDAVTKVAADRRIDRYPTDTTPTHRARTIDAWNVWENAGTEAAMLEQIVLFGYPDTYIIGIIDVALPRRFFVVTTIENITGAPPPTQLVVEIFNIVNKFRAGEERADDVTVMTAGRTFDIHPLTGLPHTFDDPGPDIDTFDSSTGVTYRETI